MPCFAPEIHEAEEEGVEIMILRNPVKYMGEMVESNKCN